METKNLDIVYFVKEAPRNEELRYSLRSVAMHMPHKRVWIFGGCPYSIVPDIRVKVKQEGKTKWDRVRTMFRMACENKEITDDFILFNDDFFIMQPMDKIEPKFRCSLDRHIEILEATRRNKPTPYSKLLRDCRDELRRLGKPTNSYELHVPFVFNKQKLLKLINTYKNAHCTRTLYGNIYGVGGTQSSDVKIFTARPEFDYKNSKILSTDDSVVNVNNDAWRFIRNSLKTKSDFEEWLR